MLLSVEDIALLALIVAASGAVLMGDFLAYLRRRRSAPAASASPVRVAGVQPRASRPAAHASPAAPVLPFVADLLVVDDSAVARAKLRKLFVAGGYSLQLASDGMEALELLKQGQYSLLITDLEMPNLNGTELIHECRRQPGISSMPIIAVSAHENLRAKFNECRDVCGVHRKPWIDDILLNHVAALIGTRMHVSVPMAKRVAGAA